MIKKHPKQWNSLGSKTRYFIITGGRGSGKSFGSVLQDPNNAKLTINRHNTKRGALWHHRISWNNIAPKILDNGIR